MRPTIRDGPSCNFFSGHVSCSPANMNPFLYFMQVSKNYSTVKTSNRCFIQLTCPTCLNKLYFFVQDVVCSLLIMCGDVESNPGLNTEELLRQILDGQKTMQARLDTIESKVENSTAAFTELTSKISSLEATIQTIQTKLIDLEDRSRRNNLLVFGLPERPDETFQSLTNTVVSEIFENMLGVKVSTVERIHRIGQKRRNKNRPVVLRLIDHREKINVLRNCSKLKGKDISVAEDFSPETRQTRRYLWESTANIRKKGEKVKLVHDKVIINGDTYAWDAAEMKRIPVLAANKNLGRNSELLRSLKNTSASLI
ncbi:uncharacterized protein LOC119399789 [Rhipicephalus sanguineus]|uniref:uncharacterized protein LOC119399789 n=1 Tax=Rhipicephalus sanguineus TaxID=34632 RepID=UPI0020C2A663|nr:uncharacterized protein LOC119399789 [Rhipicephalus sanguineus]